MSSSNQSRYARASVVVTETFPKMLRGMISTQLNAMPAVFLHGIINRDNEFLKILNSEEKLMIQSLSTDGYGRIDFSLLYTLIRYYKLVEAPTQGWGCVPQSTECKAGDDIERLRRFRNSLMHRPRADISVTEEQAFFAELINISRRIDAVSGQQMQPIESEIKNFQTCPMDAEMQLKYVALLEKYLDVKEQFSQQYGGHVIHLCYGRDIIQFFGERNRDSASEHGLEIRVFGCQDEEAIIRKINAIKDDLNRGDYNIVFEKAESGTIVIYTKVKSVVFTSKTVFESVISALIGRICNHEELDLNLPETLDICVIFEDYDYLLDFLKGPIRLKHLDVRKRGLCNQTCKNHGKQLELYCKIHDEPFCVLCVPTNHRSCSELVVLEDVVKDAKNSTALVDLEESIDRTLQMVVSYIKDQDSVLKNVEQQEETIKVKVNDMRKNLNKHLDKLEQKLMLELAKTSDSCKTETTEKISIFETTKKQLNQLKNETSQLKNFASDLQMFLGTRQIKATVTNYVKSLKTAISTAKNYNLELKIDPTLDRLLDMNDPGKIEKVESDAKLVFKEAHIDQAQIPVTKVQTIHDTKVQFQIKQKGDTMLISGCVMLQNGDMLISDYWGKEQLLEYNDKGKHIRDIPVSSKPYDLTLIDTDRIAVSYGDSDFIEIINITNNVVEKNIKLGNNCWGISYQDGKLYTVVENKGIVIVDMTGKTIYTIECDVSYVDYLTTTKDRIYYTDYCNNTIHCCSMTGEHIWVFKDQSIVMPMGLSVDKNQNVYVVGQHSHNLTQIQHDGTVSKTSLTNSDGLQCPRAVYFDKSKKVFVCNQFSGEAFVFSII